MKKNEIYLTFDNTLNNLAGYDFGLKIYNEQLKDKLDFSRGFTIIFPSTIIGVAASFVQGLFSQIIEKFGLLSTKNRASIKAVNDQLAKSIKKKID